MTTTDKLPPLAEEFRSIVKGLEAKERSARARKYSYRQVGGSPYQPEAWEFDCDLYNADAQCFRRAAEIAAPYDALIRQQEARIAELEAALSKFRELARDAANIPSNLDAMTYKAFDLAQRLAALHKEE